MAAPPASNETAVLYVVVETVMGQVVEPLLYGHSTGLSPFAVIVSALFWSFLWWRIGLILSTPFTVLLVVLGRHVVRHAPARRHRGSQCDRQ